MNAVHIVVAMKPIEGNFVENVLSRGVAGLAIDNSRIGNEEMPVTKSDGTFVSENKAMGGHNTGRIDCGTKEGRWPGNIMHDGSDEVVAQFPETTTGSHKPYTQNEKGDVVSFNACQVNTFANKGDSGSAARYFKEIQSD